MIFPERSELTDLFPPDYSVGVSRLRVRFGIDVLTGPRLSKIGIETARKSFVT
jgi:hypothetical protein